MPQIVRLSPDHRIVEVCITGPINDPESLALISRGLELQRESGIPDALVDCAAMSHAIPHPEIVQLAEYLATMDLPDGYRQAVIRPKDLHTAMSVDLWEAACNNRGVSVKVLRERDEAIAWLSEG